MTNEQRQFTKKYRQSHKTMFNHINTLALDTSVPAYTTLVLGSEHNTLNQHTCPAHIKLTHTQDGNK